MNVGIVGAGIMGRLIAFTLVNSGHQVTIYDQDADDGSASCSMAAAGMLAPVYELIKSQGLIYRLGIEALETHWPRIMTSVDHDVYFMQRGSLVVSHPQDQSELLNFISLIDSKNEIHEMQPVYKKLNKSEFNELEPELTKFNEAYYLPSEAHFDNQALLNALKISLQNKQVRWHSNTYVREIVANKICTAAETREYEIVFDCRGMGAAGVFNDLKPVRGEMIWLHATEVNIQRPIRFMHPRYSLYIVPRPDNTYIIGASEIYAEDYSKISVRSTLELLTAAYYLHPAFAEARIMKTVTHCRPSFPDHLPKIKSDNGCIAVNGLYRHGFLIAPTLAEEINRWLEKGRSSLHYPQIWEFN